MIRDRKTPKLPIPTSIEIPVKFYKIDDAEDKARGEYLMKIINRDLAERADTDGRSELFDKKSPSYMPLGSLVLVEYVHGRQKPCLDVLVGYYIRAKNLEGLTSFTIITKIMGTVISFCFPVYSPAVRRIKVIQKGDCNKDLEEAPGFSFEEAKNKIVESKIRRIISEVSVTGGTYDIKA